MGILLCVLTGILIIEFSFLILTQRRNHNILEGLEIRINKILDSVNVMAHTDNDESGKEQWQSDQNSHDTSDSDRAEKIRTHREEENRQSIFQALKKVNCSPELNENMDISVAYQGENFLLQFNGAFIRIWDLSWLRIKNTDDNFTILKDAANYANFSFGPVIIMHSPDDEGRIVVSSRMDILYVPSENDNEGYITSVLDSFFGIKHSLHRELDRLNSDPSDRTLFDNPIGFDTASLSDQSSPQVN